MAFPDTRWFMSNHSCTESTQSLCILTLSCHPFNQKDNLGLGGRKGVIRLAEGNMITNWQGCPPVPYQSCQFQVWKFLGMRIDPLDGGVWGGKRSQRAIISELPPCSHFSLANPHSYCPKQALHFIVFKKC